MIGGVRVSGNEIRSIRFDLALLVGIGEKDIAVILNRIIERRDDTNSRRVCGFSNCEGPQTVPCLRCHYGIRVGDAERSIGCKFSDKIRARERVNIHAGPLSDSQRKIHDISGHNLSGGDGTFVLGVGIFGATDSGQGPIGKYVIGYLFVAKITVPVGINIDGVNAIQVAINGIGLRGSYA
jgi:hypothetical protein